MDSGGLHAFIRAVPDFPRPGVIFRDITPLLANAQAFQAALHELAGILRRHETDQIIAIEARGFIFGAALAAQLKLPLHLVRKPGKLPRTTIGIDYALEYGTDRLETHHDALVAGLRYAIVDDVIATGGTAAAVIELVRRNHAEVACVAALLELGFLDGRSRLGAVPVESVLRYD